MSDLARSPALATDGGANRVVRRAVRRRLARRGGDLPGPLPAGAGRRGGHAGAAAAARARGHDGFRAFFDTLFGALPDLRGEVRGWTPEPDGVTIELACAARSTGCRSRHARPHRAARGTHPLAARADGPASAAGRRRAPSAHRPPAADDAGARSRRRARSTARSPGSRSAASRSGRRASCGRGMAAAFGAGLAATALDYMDALPGIRAVALGVGWLTSSGAARSLAAPSRSCATCPTRSPASATCAGATSRVRQRARDDRATAPMRSSAR